MKRILCFIVSFALCLGLCPVGVWAEGDEAEPDPDNGDLTMVADDSSADPHYVENEHKFDTKEYTFTFTGTNSSAIIVTGTGRLTLTGTGKVIASGLESSGIEVQSGGSLTVTDTVSSVQGRKFALNIASGAEKVTLSGGMYSGPAGAIVFDSEPGTAEDYAAILEDGYAFFDKDNNLVSPANVNVENKALTKLTVKKCGHKADGWTNEDGDLNHTCPYCGKEEKCTFTFKQDGTGTCDFCGGGITVSVVDSSLADLVYDGSVKPGSPPPVTVTLGSGDVLTEDSDYDFDYEPTTDAGVITVTVTGIKFNGTFTKTYEVKQDEPGISWDAATCSLNYDGGPVEPGDLPHITITIKASEDLHPYLQYFYRKTGETEFTPGLPTNAGEYEVKAYLPESQNYMEAETDPCLTLTVNKIPAVATAPVAKTLTYNREAQELVTAGALAPGAAAEGAVIEYKLGADGAYSAEIPTGTNVSSYNVYYRVADTENYTGVSETLIKNPDTKHPSARINHREITPTIELEYKKTMYTGEIKEPNFTVKDGDYDIPGSEYTFAYSDNRNVGTATLTITNASNGDYKLTTATATFEITNKPQDALTITQKPNSVIYGDKFTLGTQGGSGSGDVTWEITSGADVAEVDANSGQVTIVGHGSFTVQATKSGIDPATGKPNHDDATAIWTMTAEKKKVTATVTAEDKFYGETYNEGDELNVAKVHAVVEQGVLPGDEINITGLTGTFSDKNAGVDKTVTVDTSGASISGTNSGHYAVTYSSLSVKATIHKAVVHITEAPVPANLVYSGAAQTLLDNSVLVIDTEGVSVEYSLSKDGTYSTEIPKGTNAGAYTVWYRVKETDNYTGLAPASVDVTIAPKPVTPTVKLSGEGLTEEADGSCFYIYDGSAKEPVVTLTETEGTIPADQYTVSYSANTNVGTATVTVTAKADGNYVFTPDATVAATFEIKKEQAKVITAPEAAGDPLTFNTRDQKLVTAGTASGGTMVYRVGETGDFLETIPARTNAADYTVYYKVRGDGNHSDSEVDSVKVTIAPKTVNNPTIELLDGDGNALVSYTYDGTAKEPIVVVKDGSDEIGAGEYNVVYSDNVDAGRATVSITDKTGGNYTVTGSATFVIQKANITFTTYPTDAAVIYNGTAQELLTPGTFDGGTVQYALGSKTSTYNDAIPTATNAGTYKVYYRVIGDKNHNDYYPSTEIEATIQRKELTKITIELSPRGFEYDGTPKLPAVTVKDGNTVLPEEEYDWSCNVDDPTNVGTYTITISDAANGNYDLTGVTNKTATFTIGQTAQDALVIEGKPAATYYGDSFQLSVSGGSGDGAVTWRPTDGPATVDNDGNVTITGVGKVTITVEKDADTNYLAAQTQWSFTAAPMPIEATVEVASRDYDGTKDATVTSASITTINNDKVTITPASITATFDTPAVGEGKTVTLDTSKVEVTGADVAKYAISYPATVTADITQEITEITTPPAGIAPLTYNGQPQALVTAGQTNVGFIVYSLDGSSFSPEVPTGTNAGSYDVYYKVDGTADYTGVDVNTKTVTIASKTVTPKIEVEDSSYLYDGTKKSPKITVWDDKTLIDGDQYTVTWAGNDNQSEPDMLRIVGTYTATIQNIENGNYSFSTTTEVEITPAAQAALSITGQPEHVRYGDTVTTLGTTGGSGQGTVKWTLSGGTNSSINETTGALQVKDTGTLTVTAVRTVPNYGTVSGTWTFTVEPKPVTAVVTVAAKDYDGTTNIADGAITAKVKDDDLVLPTDSIDIAGLKGDFDNANAGAGKEVTLDCSDPDFTITCDTAKYTVIIPATAQANITPREVTVTVVLSDHDLKTDTAVTPNKYYYAFDGKEKTPAVAVTGVDGAYNATLAASDYSVDYAKNQNVGTATVTVTAKAGGNYTFADKEVEFEIRSGAAVLTKAPEAKALTYNGAAQDLVDVGTATGGKVVYLLGADNADKDDAQSYSETIPQGKDAGTYTVFYMVKGDSNHTSTAPGQVSVTIKPREITPKITLSQTSYVYDGNECKPAVTVEDGSDTIGSGEYTVSYRDNTNAGTATVIVSDNNGGNYIVNGTANFEIKKKAPEFTAPEANTGLKYNGAVQELVKAGVCNDGTLVYSVNGGSYSAAVPSASAVGDYEIKYKVQGDQNHSDTAETTLGTVSIGKNTVNNPVISLSSEQFTFNGGQQKPTIDVYDNNGNLIPKNEYSATITPTTGGSASIVDVGTYTVTITTPESSNYVITANNTRTFEIVPANQETISITGTKAQVRYGDTIQLGVTGSGIGTVTWTVTGNSSISANGLLEVKDVGGPIKVTVKRSAGGNYTDVSATWEFSAAKKQITAVVTADDRPYAANDTTATVHVSVPGSELVSGDSITIENVTGSFADPNVGVNKKVTVNSEGAPVTGTNAENYQITIPATTTASITAVAATVDGEPTPNDLTYDASQAQELVTAGTVTGGIMVYSLDRTNFTSSIPKAKDAGDYTVYFKAQGDGNHTDSGVGTVPVTIDKQEVTPTIGLSPSGAKYDGEEHKPNVTLWDGANNEIPTSEYIVTYVTDGGKNWTDQGTYTVRIENKNNGNYIVATAEKQFTISTTAQNPLTITNKPGLVYYGDTFTLSAVGGSGDSAVTWSVEPAGGVVEIDENGFVKIIGTGSAVIKAEKSGGENYETATATYPLNALKKPVTAIVTADDKVFDEGTSAAIHVTWKNGDLVGNDTINTAALTGTFDTPDVGSKKTVTITGGPISSDKYEITIPATTTASIFKADAKVPDVAAVSDLKYTGSAQNLVTGGDGNTRYSDSRDGVYSPNVPTGTNAGTYTVWYKELGDPNHNDSAPQAKTVTIGRKTLDPVNITLSGNDLKTDNDGKYSYVYDGNEKKPTVTIMDGAAVVPAGEYTVSYSDNKNVGTATVTVTSNEGGNYTFTEQPVTFTITSAAAQLTKSPEAKSLTFTGQAQELVTTGTADGGHIEYSLDGTTYSESIPKGTNAGTYTVTYKVVGEGNYASGAETWTVSVTIKQKEIVSPKVSVSGGPYTYDGDAKEPVAADIKVEDGVTEIPTSEYTVSFRDNVDAGSATVIITNANGGNYIVNGTGSFTIGKADVSDVTAPTGMTLPYNGGAQALATAGTASGGTMVYSLEQNGGYSPVIPTGTAVGSYTVWYKVQGDGNHNDTDPVSVDASIVVNEVKNPTVQVTPKAVTYNGKKQEPTVKITDNNGQLIDGSEYTVTFTMSDGNTDLIKVGTYSLTVTATGGNYDFTGAAINGTFEILPADQTPLTITGTRERVCYGDMFQLGTSAGSGTITWAVSDGAPASIGDNGLLTVTGVGSVTVTATSTATGHNDQTATWTFYAEKKPVTAVVTAESKTYDGVTPATTTVTATLQSSDLVSGDTVKITLSGTFDDPNAGTDKKVKVDSTSPNFTECTGNYANYNISYPATATASIFKADIKAEDVTAPTAKTDLAYTGLALVLVEPGSCPDGTLEYSTDNITYSASLPTGTDAGPYEVWYRVKGDGNHNDTESTKLGSVTIARQEVENPTIEFKPTGASYDGAVHIPDVTVKDNNARTIPTGEYTVAYEEGKNWKDVGKYKVTITNKADGNYVITEKVAEFEIYMMGQSPLTITNQPGAVKYGDTFTLSTTGGSGTGAVSWQSSNPEVASIDAHSGLVKVLKSGAVKIIATKQSDSNYGETTAEWTFSAEKKPVKAVVTAKNKVFDTSDNAELVITWKDGDLLGNDADAITLNLTGTFSNANVGDNKIVTISGTAPVSDKYDISWNTTTTASITPAAAKVTAPGVSELTYNGQPQPLVTAGTPTNGTIFYSLDNVIYTGNIPQATNAGTYTVWYKVEGDANYADVAPKALAVTISPKTVNLSDDDITLSVESFDYDSSPKRPDVVAVKDGSIVIPASEYTVGYSNNVNAGTAKVIISDVPGGNYVVSGEASFTIKAASAYLKDAPKANSLTYNGFAQELLTPGTAVNGRVVYSTSQNGTYTTSIPTEINANTYQVWYKVEGLNGAEVSEDDAAPRSKTVTIAPKQVTPIVLVGGKNKYSTPYTGGALEPALTVIVESKQLTSGSDYLAIYDDNINPGTATVTVQNLGGNYQFFAVASFEITKVKAEFQYPPTELTEKLVYTGEAQELLEDLGFTQGGTVVCSVNGGPFVGGLPQGTEVGTYYVSVKVQGNATHEDSDVKTYRVTIGKNTIAENDLSVTLSANSLKYIGSELKPTVTVRDNKGNIIAASEYSVSYSNNINVGQADVTVTSSTKNYSFSKTVHFTITDADAPTLEITGKQDTVYYGDTLRLGTTGGSGTVTWSVESGSESAESLGGGRFKIKGSGSITVKAETSDSSDTWTFYADPKPVTAIVTAEDKPYDHSTSATLTVTVNSGLVNNDAPFTLSAAGHFENADVGAGKTVVIDNVTIPAEVSKKYSISYPGTTTAAITAAEAKVTKDPQKVEGTLTYNGQEQPLVTKGEATGGRIKYSLDGETYTYAVPTGTDAKSYTVWYKVVADDSNYKDSKAVEMEPITIAPNTDTPTVKCVQETFQFDGTPKTPTVVVLDSEQRIIPENEYIVIIPTAIAVGTYTVTVTDKTGGNYEFSSTTGGTFKIEESSQAPLSVDTDKFIVYYGDIFRLNAAGGSGSGAIEWSIAAGGGSIAEISSSGVVTVKGTGGFTVEAYREAADGYGQSNTVSVPFEARPKPVTPTVTADDKPYDGTTVATLHAAWTSGDLVGDDAITLSVGGEFASADVGTGKQVKVTSHTAQGTGVEKYDIRWPEATTASIYKVDAQIASAPLPADLTYNKTAQALVTGGSTVGNIGTIVYSTSQNGTYSTAIPTGIGAGTYTVWYKVADSVNYTGIPAAEVKVEIKKADLRIITKPSASAITSEQPLSASVLNGGSAQFENEIVSGSFAWAQEVSAPINGAEYDVIFTPEDTDNYNTVTGKVAVTVNGKSAPSAGDTPTQAQTQTTVHNGAASTVLSASDGNKLVQEAAASQSRNVVIKPEISGNVTKSEVSIPSATVNRLGSSTDANLTVSSPVGDVTIPNKALDTLGQAGGKVSVATEQVGQGVALTLTSGGETVTQVPGGVTLSVPVEDAAPGTVAVIVNEDGTRETVKNSVVNGDVMNIPLSGSATVEIVDNSKDFDDVPPESWEADAVAFASSHELFNGTSETTFSPDTAMSRGMLATVLYRLEGDPDMELTDAFSDVADGAWYADGVAWAAANGIAGGYGDNQFGPNDDITREQFVVMLWRYAGRPEASSQGLDFTDADEASGFAREALCWAVENGILNGVGGGALDPKGTATRAQAAQLLKNFMERA